MFSLRSHVSHKSKMSYLLFISHLKDSSDIFSSERPFMFQNPVFTTDSFKTYFLPRGHLCSKILISAQTPSRHLSFSEAILCSKILFSGQTPSRHLSFSEAIYVPKSYFQARLHLITKLLRLRSVLQK